MSEESFEDTAPTAAPRQDDGTDEALRWLRALGDDLAAAVAPPDMVEERLGRVTDPSAHRSHQRPTHAQEFTQTALAMLAEAEFLLSQRLTDTPTNHAGAHDTLAEIRNTLARARALANERPSIATALTIHAVQTLEAMRPGRATAYSAHRMRGRPAAAPELSQTALAMLAEAEFLFNRRLMATSAARASGHDALTEIHSNLDRARALANKRPSIAIALTIHAVQTLETLSTTRMAVES
jgi:hypothetical protein